MIDDDDDDDVVSDILESAAEVINILDCGLPWAEADGYFSTG